MTTSIWKTHVSPDLMENYEPSQIFTTEKIELFYRALPKHIYSFNEGCKKIKEANVLVKCNKMGTVKTTPLDIRGSKKHRYFTGVWPENL